MLLKFCFSFLTLNCDGMLRHAKNDLGEVVCSAGDKFLQHISWHEEFCKEAHKHEVPSFAAASQNMSEVESSVWLKWNQTMIVPLKLQCL